MSDDVSQRMPHILPGDDVRTPDGVAVVKRIEGDVIICRHTIRGPNSPGSHATTSYRIVRWNKNVCVRVVS